jgi:hypothetical protein
VFFFSPLVPKRELLERGSRLNQGMKKMAVGGAAAILAFFGVDPKKVPAFLAPQKSQKSRAERRPSVGSVGL